MDGCSLLLEQVTITTMLQFEAEVVNQTLLISPLLKEYEYEQ